MKLKWLDKSISAFKSVFGKKNTEGEIGHANRLINSETPSRVLEAYRMARTNMLYTGKNDAGRVFGFTGAAPYDGKSLTCANVAISFAMSGKKVLLVDCDMHRPTQNISFGVQIAEGLSEYLTGIDKEAVIAETKYNNLSILSAGRCPPNPAELLDSERFTTLIEKLRSEYDCVFLDLPPFNIISDAAIVAPALDGYIFVVRAGKSDRRRVRNALESIEHVGGKILGFILNDTDRHVMPYNRTGYYSGYYHYHYHYYHRRKGQSQQENGKKEKKSKKEKTSKS